jgi:hypothetical protein
MSWLVENQRLIGRCAWVSAWVGLVAGQLHALSRFATADGAEDSWIRASSSPTRILTYAPAPSMCGRSASNRERTHSRSAGSRSGVAQEAAKFTDYEEVRPPLKLCRPRRPRSRPHRGERRKLLGFYGRDCIHPRRIAEVTIIFTPDRRRPGLGTRRPQHSPHQPRGVPRQNQSRDRRSRTPPRPQHHQPRAVDNMIRLPSPPGIPNPEPHRHRSGNDGP